MVRFQHIQCPLHRYTFSVERIRFWVDAACEGLVLNLSAGKTKLAVKKVRSELVPVAPADYHFDALEFFRSWHNEKFDTILIDPPYAYRKSMELYNGIICIPFRQLKYEIVRWLKPGGKVITFGYQSIVMDLACHFQLEQICLFSHRVAVHDTIASVERIVPTRKQATRPDFFFLPAPLTKAGEGKSEHINLK